MLDDQPFLLIPHRFFHNAIAWPQLNFIFKKRISFALAIKHYLHVIYDTKHVMQSTHELNVDKIIVSKDGMKSKENVKTHPGNTKCMYLCRQ